MAITKRYYGIKFPFTHNNDDGLFLDLNERVSDKVASEILHVLLTPVRTRIRKPDFGTNLAKYIFDPNDGLTWDGVRNEAISAVNRYVRNVNLTDIQVIANEDDHHVFLDLKYSVQNGNSTENNELGVKLI